MNKKHIFFGLDISPLSRLKENTNALKRLAEEMDEQSADL